mmetsp:Transcript_141141/g.260079  ORF Transcript_141141/g.260079 Transcript_141141/m.260079 type:complete len:163 (-) Transcript_141141:40-528(-)
MTGLELGMLLRVGKAKATGGKVMQAHPRRSQLLSEPTLQARCLAPCTVLLEKAEGCSPAQRWRGRATHHRAMLRGQLSRFGLPALFDHPATELLDILVTLALTSSLREQWLPRLQDTQTMLHSGRIIGHLHGKDPAGRCRHAAWPTAEATCGEGHGIPHYAH